jgi:tetratricopeptide (TPR) repeat protein
MPDSSQPIDPSDFQAIDAKASALMKQGIRLMEAADSGAVSEALQLFDRALEIRRRLPVAEIPVLRYGLAACWLNRADALVRLGGAERIASALLAYDEGIALVRGLPLDEDPRFPRRLAIAYQNRGLAIQAQRAAAFADAIVAFTTALEVLDGVHAEAISDRTYLRAAVSLNLANALAADAGPDSWPRAREAAERAMMLVAGSEADELPAAEVGLKARHVFCRVIARGQSLEVVDGSISDDVHEATDIVDDGLALARRWEQKGEARFRPIACDLFRFGARVYAFFQPQFLTEFVRENLDAAQSSVDYVESDEVQSAAREALSLSSFPGRA